MNNGLSAILKDIDFGPVDKKLAAIGNLISTKGISLETVQPTLENIVAKTSDDSVLKFYALIALVIHGDHRDAVVDALISCYEMLPSRIIRGDEAGSIINFPWLAGKVKFPLFSEADSFVAIVEAMSHIRGSERVANMLHEWLPTVSDKVGNVDMSKYARTFIIQALGSIGSPVSRPVLEYYRDNCAGSSEGDAAKIALEHFGAATFFEIKNLHDKNTKSKSGCFIATAVYGEVDAPEVMVFRHFRDEVLLISFIGRRFISFYYLFSPYAAKLISKSAFAKSLVRIMILKPLMWLINYTR